MSNTETCVQGIFAQEHNGHGVHRIIVEISERTPCSTCGNVDEKIKSYCVDIEKHCRVFEASASLRRLADLIDRRE